MRPIKLNISDEDIENAVSKFSQHLMSNTKWVRLIDSLVENADKIKKVEFKKVQNDIIGELYLNGGMTYEFDYWQNGFEGQNSLGGWLTFKEIEYLVFLKTIDSNNNNEQDLEQITTLKKKWGNST